MSRVQNKLTNSISAVLTIASMFSLVSQAATTSDSRRAEAAHNLIEQGKPAEAVAALDKLIKQFPADASLYTERSRGLGVLKKYQQSADDATKAIQLDPKSSKAYNSRSADYSYLGKYKEALDDANQALKLDPKSFKAYVNRGSVKGRMGNIQDAISDLSKAIELNPTYAKSWEIRAFAHGEAKEYQKRLTMPTKPSN